MSDTIYMALHAVQAKLSGVTKDAKNPHFRSQYADRTSILQAIRPVLHDHGFILMQTLSDSNGETAAMKTTLIYVPTGERIENTAVMPLQKTDPQGYGSAVTYLSRYSLVSFFALPLLDDDDGNAASGRSDKEQTFARKPKPKPEPEQPEQGEKPPEQDAKSDDKPAAKKGKTTKLWGSK